MHWAVVELSLAICHHSFTKAATLPMAQGGFDWGDFVDGVTSGGAKKRKQDTGEPFYGFTDFLRDLDVDLKRWSDQVDKKGMSNHCTDMLCSGQSPAISAAEDGGIIQCIILQYIGQTS